MQELTPKSPFYSKGLRFSCQRCSSCCRFEPGYVFLSEKDKIILETSLNLGNKEFSQSYCRWVTLSNGMDHLSLKEKSNYDCIFWTEDGCSVYESRPLQCRAYPFWPWILSNRKNWEMTAQSCPGIGKGELHPEDSIQNWLNQWHIEPKIHRGNI